MELLDFGALELWSSGAFSLKNYGQGAVSVESNGRRSVRKNEIVCLAWAEALVLDKGITMDDDAEDFLAKVQDVSRLVDGLANDKLTPDYVAKRTKELGLDEELGSDNNKKCEKQALLKQKNNDGIDGNSKTDTLDNDLKETARDEEIQLKVRELQYRRNQRLRARERFEEYIKDSEHLRCHATDYNAWDLWMPSDDEDELFENLQPSHDAGFR